MSPGNVNFKGMGERKREATQNKILLIYWFDHHVCRSLGVMNFRNMFASSIMPQIWRVPGPDRTTFSTLFALWKFFGISTSFPWICRKLNTHLRSLGFLACVKTLSACSRDMPQVGISFTRYSRGFRDSVSFLWWLWRSWSSCCWGSSK